MVDNDKTIITLGFFAFMTIIGLGLLYLLKREPEPVATAQAFYPQAFYAPQNTFKEKPVATEETRPIWPHIINHNLTEANRIYEIKIPREGLRVWSLRCRDDVNIHYSFEPSFSTYMTLDSGETVNQDTSPNKSIYAIYVRCATPNVTVELELWR